MRIERFPFKREVFRALAPDLRLFDRDTLQKILIFYARLDEANLWRFLPPGASRDKAVLESLQKAFKQGDALREALRRTDPQQRLCWLPIRLHLDAKDLIVVVVEVRFVSGVQVPSP